jgi:hypothetical protein
MHHDPELSIETTILRSGREKQHALQRYTTDGKESTSIGADGDTFVTSIIWSEHALVFTITEHEDGHTIESSETWSINDQSGILKRVRRSSKFKGDQVILYTRARL